MAAVEEAIRPYLDARMPTFRLGDGEIGALVRFFGAASAQPIPYVEPSPEPVNGGEREAARAAFLESAHA